MKAQPAISTAPHFFFQGPIDFAKIVENNQRSTELDGCFIKLQSHAPINIEGHREEGTV